MGTCLGTRKSGLSNLGGLALKGLRLRLRMGAMDLAARMPQRAEPCFLLSFAYGALLILAILALALL